jgi:hypothetical protein
MSEQELQEEIERLRAENEKLKNKGVRGLNLKVSEKGAVSLYGIGRFPVTLYKEQWAKILGMAREIEAFICRMTICSRPKNKNPGVGSWSQSGAAAKEVREITPWMTTFAHNKRAPSMSTLAGSQNIDANLRHTGTLLFSRTTLLNLGVCGPEHKSFFVSAITKGFAVRRSALATNS